MYIYIYMYKYIYIYIYIYKWHVCLGSYNLEKEGSTESKIEGEREMEREREEEREGEKERGGDAIILGIPHLQHASLLVVYFVCSRSRGCCWPRCRGHIASASSNPATDDMRDLTPPQCESSLLKSACRAVAS